MDKYEYIKWHWKYLYEKIYYERNRNNKYRFEWRAIYKVIL